MSAKTYSASGGMPVEGVTQPGTSRARLTVVYDETCPFCLRCRDWLDRQPTHVPLRLLAAGSGEAQDRFGGLPWLGTELVVADDEGPAWVGAAAFLMCLWATRAYRGWAQQLATPALAPLAARLLAGLSARRGRLGAFTGRHDQYGCGACRR